MRHPGAAMTRQQLLDHAWDSAYEAHSNVVDVYVGYLRDKVDRPFGRRNVETVRGVGYRLVARAVSITTGIGQRARSLRQTSSPSMPGSIRSSTTRSGGSSATRRKASYPSCTHSTV